MSHWRSGRRCRGDPSGSRVMDDREALLALAELAKEEAHLVPSPCVSVCRMDEDTGLCHGCLRTIDEIIAWGRLGEVGKRQVWREIVRRATIHPA